MTSEDLGIDPGIAILAHHHRHEDPEAVHHHEQEEHDLATPSMTEPQLGFEKLKRLKESTYRLEVSQKQHRQHTYPCVQDRKTPCKGEAFYKLHIKGKGVSFILRNGSKKTFIYAVNCAPNRKLMNVKYKIMNGQPVLLVLKNIACGEQLLTMYDSAVPNMFP